MGFSYFSSHPVRIARSLCRVIDVESTARSGEQHAEPRTESPCPWKGLDAYESGDDVLFVGRERVVRQLWAAMETSTLAGVVGASGSGKSSLLLAGLSQHSVVWAVVLPGANPMQRLRETMSRLPTPIVGPTCPILAADQLEEIFTLCEDEAERAAYLDELCDIAESGRARVVVALRSDHYGSCAPYRRFADALSQSHVLLGAPTEEELRRIVTVPAFAAGLTIERGLDDEIIDDVVGESGALPLLSHALRQTWLLREGDILTRDAYRRAGGVRGAIARTAEELWIALPEARQRATRTILTRLAAPGAATADSARRVATNQLVSAGDVDGEAALRALIDARLVTVDSGTAEIAHEAVFREWPRLRGWIEEDRDALRMLGQLRVSARAWGEQKDESALYRGSRLQAVVDVLNAVDVLDRTRSAVLALDEPSKAFVGASIDAAKLEETERVSQVQRERRANRRLRVLLSTAVALLVVAMGTGAFAVRQRNRATYERRTADARRLAAVAADVRADRLDLAVLLSIEANNRHDDLETRGALFAALNDQPGLVRYLYQNDPLIDIAVDRTGRFVAFAADDARLQIWDIGQNEPVLLRSVSFGDGITAQRTKFLPDGRILTGDTSGGIHIVNAEKGVSILDAQDHGEAGVGAVAISASGDLIASGGDDGLVRLTDARTGRQVREPLTGHNDAIQFAEFSPGGDVLATGSSDGGLRFWSTKTWAPIGQPIAFDYALSDFRWLADQRSFVVATEASVQFFDAASRRPLSPPIRAHDGFTYRLQLIDAGTTLATSGEDGYVRFWDTTTYRPSRPELRGHAAGVWMDIAEKANRMVSGSDDGTIAVWDLRGASPGATPVAEKPDGRTQVFTTPGGRVFTADRAGMVREWDANGRPVGRGVSLKVPLTALSVSSSGTRAAVARDDGTVQVFELPSGRPVTPSLAVSAKPAGVAISPDGEHLLTSRTDGKCDACFTLFDLSQATLNRRAFRPPGLRPGQRTPATSAVFDASGRRFVTGTTDGWVDGWDTTTGTHLWSVGLPRGIRSLAFSPDGTRIAVGANSGLLEVLDATTGKRLQQLRGHRGPIAGVAFSPDNTLLASESTQDHTLRIWRLDLGLTVGRPAWLGVDGLASLGWTDNGRKVAAPHFRTGAMLFDIDPDRLRREACGLVRRNLTRNEWRQYFGSKSYRPTCPSYPQGT